MEDSGVGIEEKYQNKIFDIFEIVNQKDRFEKKEVESGFLQ